MKRRGPMTMLMTSRRCQRWVATAMLLSVLYVLSSGPTRMVAFRAERATLPAGSFMFATNAVRVAPWWMTTYRPLFWASQLPWGTPLDWYWNLFPIRDA